MKKKAWIVVLIIVIFLIAGGLYFFRKFKKGSGPVQSGRYAYVEKVADITGFGLGDSSRFMGIVESQETKKVEKSPEKKVKELYVKVGDLVKEGDSLFIYDTDEMQMTLESKELELESLKNIIETQNASIEDLKKQRDSVSGDDKLGFSSQINSLTAEIKQNEYQVTVKELEIERQKDAIANAIVTSPMTGIVKSIQDDSSSNDDMGYYGYGNENNNAYMTIMAVGNYRVKGTASELNIYSIVRDTPVIVRSRVDETRTWSGVVTKVDQEPAGDNNNNMGYYDNPGESASKYNFYVDLDDVTDLMLGQHLYIELDYGQGEQKSGLFLYSYYIVNPEDGNHYVWKKNENGRMEKQTVTLGEYDERLDAYQIVAGLTVDDYIAFPDGSISEGDIATTNYDDIMNQDMNSGVENYPEDMPADMSGDMSYDMPEGMPVDMPADMEDMPEYMIEDGGLTPEEMEQMTADVVIEETIQEGDE